MVGSMKISEYLRSLKLSPEKFARDIGVSGQAVRRYMDGGRFPRVDVLERITKATHGKVTANDFMQDRLNGPFAQARESHAA